MSDTAFKVGDRVVVTAAFPCPGDHGTTGTVVRIHDAATWPVHFRPDGLDDYFGAWPMNENELRLLAQEDVTLG